MKIAYCSDLHLEMNNISPSIFQDDSDVLVLAGDILVANDLNYESENSIKYMNFFQEICSIYKDVIYVFGNHEYYHSKINHVSDIIHKKLKFDNLHILDDEGVTIQNQNFFGGTLFTNMNNNDPITKYMVKNGMNDFNYILQDDGRTIIAEHFIDKFDECIEKLKEYLCHHDNVIVITHHSPSEITVPYIHKKHVHLNGGYCSELSEFILEHKIPHWIFGHQHQRNTFQIGDTKLHVNALGYQSFEKYFTEKFELRNFYV